MNKERRNERSKPLEVIATDFFVQIAELMAESNPLFAKSSLDPIYEFALKATGREFNGIDGKFDVPANSNYPLFRLIRGLRDTYWGIEAEIKIDNEKTSVEIAMPFKDSTSLRVKISHFDEDDLGLSQDYYRGTAYGEYDIDLTNIERTIFMASDHVKDSDLVIINIPYDQNDPEDIPISVISENNGKLEPGQIEALGFAIGEMRRFVDKALAVES